MKIACISLIILLLNINNATFLVAETIELNLKQSIEMAITASEDYAIQENQIKQLKAKYIQVRSEIYPNIYSSSSWTHNTTYPGTDIKDYDSSLAVTASQLLWSFGRVKSAINAADYAINITHLNKNASKKEIIAITKQAYYAALLSEKALSIIEASYENAVINKKILEERSATGRVSKRDNIKISADVAARIPQLSNAKATLNSTHNTLKTIIGINNNETLHLNEPIIANYQELDLNFLKNKLLNDEPIINALKQNVELRRELIQQQKAGNYPTISLLGSYAYQGSADNASIGNDNMDKYGFVGVKMTVPVFTGWKTKALIDEAFLNYEKATLEFKKGQEQLLLQLENAVSEYHTLIETLQANDNAVDLAQQAYQMSQELFKSGQISVTDLNDAELQLTIQKLAKEQTIFNLNIKLALIDKLT